jgi:hypothetical protein
MSYTPINNDETGSSVRSKINSMFNTLFNTKEYLWTLISGRIKPVNDYPVDATEVNVSGNLYANNSNVQIINNKLRLFYAAGFTELHRRLIIDNEGFANAVLEQLEEKTGDADYIEPTQGKKIYAPEVKTEDIKLPGLGGFAESQRQLMIDNAGNVSAVAESSSANGMAIVGETGNSSPQTPNEMVYLTDAHITRNLPVASSMGNGEFLYRLNNETGGYALTISATSSINLWMDDNTHDIQSKMISTTEKGAWVKLKSNGFIWTVIQHGGNWIYV